jgi:methyl acetate hydrolase
VSASIDRLLQDAVDRGDVPSVAAIAADRDGIIYEGAAGPRVVGGDAPLTVDTHFRIMSMTKMVITAAALQLGEQGELDLEAPIDTYRPEWADLEVLAGFDGDTPRMRPPAGRATVRHLLTHTSGVGYSFYDDGLTRWESVTGAPRLLSGSNGVFAAPLLTDPGSRFIYGTSTDWLGRVIEVATGVDLDTAVRDGVTGPLGMNETGFQVAEGWRETTTPVHIKGKDGTWNATRIELNQHPEHQPGGHGLYSTPRDYIRFQRALLGGGELDGVRILRADSVDAAFTNQIGELDFPPTIRSYDPVSSHDLVVGPGWKWGYGLLLNTGDLPGMRRTGSGAWAGMCNTYFWVDRSSGLAASIYSNFLPFVPPEALRLQADFELALYASR